MTAVLAWLKALPIALWLGLGGAVALVGGYEWWAGVQRANGARDVALAQSQAALKILGHSLDSARTAFKVDTLLLPKLVDRWHDAATRVDTQWLHDSIPVPVQVVRDLMHTADTAITSCRVTVADCTKLVQLERARADTLASQVKLLKQLRPSWWARCGVSAGVAGVLAGGKVVGGPAVVAGCKILP